MSKVRRARVYTRRGKGFLDTLKKVATVAGPIVGVAGAAAGAYYGHKHLSKHVSDKRENTRQHALLGGSLADFAKTGAKKTLTSAEVQKLRAKGHPVSIPFVGMPEKTAQHEALLNGGNNDVGGIRNLPAKFGRTPGDLLSGSSGKLKLADFAGMTPQQSGEGFLGWTGLEKNPPRWKAPPRKRKEPEPQTGEGAVWDKVKSIGKNIVKYGAPVAVGLAGAAGAHYLTKKKAAPATNPIDAFNSGQYDSSRYSDHALPYADTVTPSSYRHRPEQTPLTPNAIRALLAFKAIQAAYDPSAHHPWTASGEGMWDQDDKLSHLVGCKTCRGKGIGRKLWNGLKNVSSEVYGGVKAVGKEALPYVVPAALAVGTAAAAYHGVPGVTPGIKHGIQAVKDFDYKKALSNAVWGAPVPQTKTHRSGHSAGHRSKQYDHLDYFD